jgi:hypothetical protein
MSACSNVVVVVGLLAACSGSQGSSGHWTIDTLPGGTIVTTNTGGGTWGASPAWELVLEARIGTRDEGPASFVDLVDLEVDPLRRIYALDRRAHEIQVFDGEGAFVRTISRFGHGPGELNGAQGIAFDQAGRLWVMNQNNARFSLFDTSGALVKEFPRPLTSVRFAGWSGVFGRDGALYDFAATMAGDSLSMGYFRYDTLAGRLANAPLRLGFPMAPVMWLVQQATLDGWWAGSAAEYQLYRLSLGGDTLRIVGRSDFVPIPLDPADSQPAAPAPRVVGVNIRPPEPNHHRTISNLIADVTGHLWVVRWRPPDSTRTYLDVFDPDGRYLGELAVPYPLEQKPAPMVRGGRLYAVVKDELDVQYIVVMRILGGG